MVLLPIVVLFILIITDFLLSNFFRLRNKYFGGDSYYHYQAATEIRRKRRLFKTISVYSIPSPPDYPPLIHFFLALLPEDKILSYGRFMNVFFDILLKLFLFGFVTIITNNLWMAVLAVFIYSLIPILNQEQSQTSPRLVGALWFNLLLTFLYFYIEKSNPLLLLGGAVMVFLTLITHKFAFQTSVLVLLFLFFSRLDGWFLVPLLGGIALSIIFLRTYSLRLMIGILKGYTLWWNVGKRSTSSSIKEKKYGKFLTAAYELFGSNMTDLFLIGILLFDPLTLPRGFAFFFSIIVFLRLFSAFIFSVKYVRFLGEYYRYLEYSAFMGSFLLSYVLLQKDNLLFWAALVILSISSIVLLLSWQRQVMKHTLYFIPETLVRELEKLKKWDMKSLLVIPFTFGRAVAYLAQRKVFFTVSGYFFHMYREIYWNLMPLDDIIKKYQISHVLIMREFASSSPLKHGKEIWSNDLFTLYEI